MSTSITSALLKEFGLEPRTTAAVVQTIVMVTTYGGLALHVLQDPAVHRAALKAARGCVGAAESVAQLGKEAAASWQRASQLPTL